MGWFGASGDDGAAKKQWSENFYEDFIEQLDDDTMITIVDCHI